MFNTRRCVVLLLCALGSLAPSLAVPAEEADAQAIRHTMKSMFDKPDAPLQVDPVVVQGDHALAGWVQGGTGGRALLRKAQGKWSITVCGGDGLKDAAVLAQAGVPQAQAQALAVALVRAESRVPPATRARFSLFKGLVPVGGGHGVHNPAAAGEAHGGSHPAH